MILILIHHIHLLMYVPGIAAAPRGGFHPVSAAPHGRSIRTSLLSFSFIWYQSQSQEIGDTWGRMPSNPLGAPVFALLIWLHAPLWKYSSGLVRSLSDQFQRRIVIAAVSAASAGYLVMFAIVFDYSRWISNWAV